MQRAVSSLLVIFFILWILPLGYFIKPSQEKVACDGQRAFCMCCCHIFKKTSNTAVKVVLSCPTQGTSKETSSSGGASNYFISNKPVMPEINLQASQWAASKIFPTLPFIRSIEFVPKI